MAHPSTLVPQRGKTSWDCLPPEIRNEIIGLLPVLGGRCSLLATVARDWQSIIEPLNFAEISLTVPRLADLNPQAILLRRRSQIRYIWFRVELKHYDCSQCANTDQDSWGLDKIDDQFIADAFESLFTTLSAWEPRGDLVLDISVYSPSDNQHWFKYLSFCSDTNLGECSSRRGHEQGTTLVNDPAHGWVAGQQMQWWRGLPFVPVVGVVLLRQQTRRRWKPVALANMLTRFPNMKELCYEPWREWTKIETQIDKRMCNQTLIKSFPRTKLCKLTIFENFNESYPERYSLCPAIRVPDPAVSQKLARASLHLTTLSASFMVDAGHFFAARQDLWTWDKLTSLALTSRLWNGRRGVAMLFRYQRAQDGQLAIITVRGTSELALGIAATQAWDVVAHRHCHGRVVVQTSLIDPDVIRCHGDAIRQLGLSTKVARPVSLRQILSENR
ncbi:hypothetical protein F5X99DRAFT_431936 [Biscogniauxia marginata]|nr:hypothetical protein F5X99DRAFT_431936 [Biscogniauxia marginata]